MVVTRFRVARGSLANVTSHVRLKPANDEETLQKQDNRLETLAAGFMPGRLLALFVLILFVLHIKFLPVYLFAFYLSCL